jgi:hypothetical protein
MLWLNDGTQLGPLGGCQVPGFAFVAGGQKAIRELQVGLMERQGTLASWADETANGFPGFSRVVYVESSVQRQASLLGHPTSSLSGFSSMSSAFGKLERVKRDARWAHARVMAWAHTIANSRQVRHRRFPKKAVAGLAVLRPCVAMERKTAINRAR